MNKKPSKFIFDWNKRSEDCGLKLETDSVSVVYCFNPIVVKKLSMLNVFLQNYRCKRKLNWN